MYGADCLTEDSPTHHTLVLGEVQTVDCCMYRLPSTMLLGWFEVLLLEDSMVTIALLEESMGTI